MNTKSHGDAWMVHSESHFRTTKVSIVILEKGHQSTNLYVSTRRVFATKDAFSHKGTVSHVISGAGSMKLLSVSR